MNRTLHEADNAQRILKLTADTMLLVDRNGICIDIDIHSNLWFYKKRLLGKNIFERMPSIPVRRFTAPSDRASGTAKHQQELQAGTGG